MKSPHLLPLVALMLCASCATAPADAPQLDEIVFSNEPCFGFCPMFSFTVSADGGGTYEGEGFVAARGRHSFTVTPEQFAAFRERLAPFRPDRSVTYGYDNCDGPVATDNPSVAVTWKSASGENVTLDWYMGCMQPELRDRSDRLYRAWQELPAVAALVGEDEQRRTYGKP